MTEDTRQSILKRIGETRDNITEEPGFLEDAELRGALMGIVTLEAATMFGVLPKFGEVCGQFCADQADANKGLECPEASGSVGATVGVE